MSVDEKPKSESAETPAGAIRPPITLASQAQEVTAGSEQRFRAFFEISSVGMCEAEPYTGNILVVNRAFCAMTGYSEAELAGRPFWQITPPEDRDSIAKDFVRLFRREIAEYRVQKRSARKDRGIIWVDLTVKMVRDAGGEPVHAVAVVQDITERKRMEEEIHQYVEALKEADRCKDEFIATLAHELRNPLAPIRSCVEMLRLCKPGDCDFEWGRNLIEQQVGHMSRLVDDLLDISRITRSTLELKKEKIPLTQILDSAVQSTRSVVEQRGHRLTITTPAEPIEVVADAVRLTQVFVNLLHNAAHCTPQGGHIEIMVERDGNIAVLRVKDNGVGITADKLPFIFGIFHEAGRLYEKGHGGLGFGLTLVERLVEMHGGTVEARSAGINQGSEFIVRLPVSVEESRLIPPKQQWPGKPTISRRILVVDDYPNAAESLARLLRWMGNEVRTALDGLEGVEAAETFRPEVILLDIGMPRLNGYEAAARIRAQPWGKQIVLIALTGWGQAEDRQRTQAAGFDVHLVKPIDHGQLTILLASLAARQVN
jgi:PAS domain S-box-containing protein